MSEPLEESALRSKHRVTVFEGGSVMHKDCDTLDEATEILHAALELGVGGWISRPGSDPPGGGA